MSADDPWFRSCYCLVSASGRSSVVLQVPLQKNQAVKGNTVVITGVSKYLELSFECNILIYSI